jgi:hypothetical protein
MTNRNLTATQITYNTAQSVNFHELLYVRTRESGTSTIDHTYLTNGPGDIFVTEAQAASMGLTEEAGGHTFLAVGPFLQFSSIEESADFQITSLTVSLGGMSSSDLALFLSNQYIDQPIRVWRYWLDEDGRMVGTPVMIFDGRIDRPVISDDPNGAVTIGCNASSQWVDYQRTNGRHTNNDEQQHFDYTYYNTAATTANVDIGFKFAADAITDLKWGG